MNSTSQSPARPEHLGNAPRLTSTDPPYAERSAHSTPVAIPVTAFAALNPALAAAEASAAAEQGTSFVGHTSQAGSQEESDEELQVAERSRSAFVPKRRYVEVGCPCKALQNVAGLDGRAAHRRSCFTLRRAAV